MNNDRNVGICRRHFGAVLICGASAVLAGTIALPLAAADKESKGDGSKGNIAKTYEDCVTRGIDYLRVKGQAADGSFSSRAGIGPTALATTAMLSHGRKASDPTVAKALAYLKKFVQDDGGIYSRGSRTRTTKRASRRLPSAAANDDGATTSCSPAPTSS